MHQVDVKSEESFTSSYLTYQTAQASPMPPAPAEPYPFLLSAHNFSTCPAYGEVIDPDPTVFAEDSTVTIILVPSMASWQDIGLTFFR